MHPCEILYNQHGNGFIVGTKSGICRVTGKKSTGMPFQKWVKDTFTDHAYLYPGDIISNEAAFCFDEASEVISRKTGKIFRDIDSLFEGETKKVEAWKKKKSNKEKTPSPKDIGYVELQTSEWICYQRFRTYSHIVMQDGNWYVVTKADKEKIVSLLQEKPQIVCLTETGQKHIFFKHRIGYWQLDGFFIEPDLEKFNFLHGVMMQLLALGFSQKEIISGDYIHDRILKIGIEAWQEIDGKIKPFRGQPIFDFSAWLMYTIKSDNELETI